MVDILNFAGGSTFVEVWREREEGKLWGVPIKYPSRTSLIDMKRAAGRPQDLADIERLDQSGDTD